ncbi:MAG: hypothetical protein ACI8Y4_005459, partial [Candidatus Poriferisodalaceae bacterium]
SNAPSIAAFAADAAFSPGADRVGTEDVSIVDPARHELARRATATRAVAANRNLTIPHYIG